jgi:hypothetical protein
MESKAYHDGETGISLDLCLRTPSLPVGDAGRDEASFACDYCNRRFLSRKALGGHQNAHRLGRAFGKRYAAAAAATSAPLPPFVYWLHARRRRELWRAYLASAAVNWTWPTLGHHGGEAATAAPEVDLSLKL